jgi:hypothetical protein
MSSRSRVHMEIVQIVRQGGRLLGEALSGLVNALNPSVIVIGGDVADVHEQLFAGVREVVYQRATPLATRHLEIARSTLGDRDGAIGAAVLATEHVLSPSFIDAHWLTSAGARSGRDRAARGRTGEARRSAPTQAVARS